MNLQYENIFSTFLSKITDYSFLEYDDSLIRNQMVSWLHSSSSMPRVRMKFTNLSLDDKNAILNFTLRKSVDDESDSRFVTEIFAKAMVISWLEPQVKNILLTKQMIGGKEEKFYAQANHLSQLQQLLNSTKIELSNLLRDYGYLNNSYIKE